MAELLRTNKTGKGRGSHDHIAYLREDGGITTEDNGHSHNIVPTQIEVNDGQGNFVPQQSMEVEFVNDHTHELLPIEEKESSEKNEEDTQKVTSVMEDYEEDWKREDESRKAGQDSEDVYSHKQWDEQAKAKLEAEDRAAHTINTVEARIDSLTGYQKQNRTDFKYYPVENGDAVVADILNIVVKNITDTCWYPREESKAFEDASIAGRGLFNIYEDFDKNIRGDIIIEKFNWDECFFGPHDKEDLSDCDRIEKTKWYSKEKLKELYPDKIDHIYPENKAVSGSNQASEDWDTRLRTLELYDGKNYRMIEQEKKIYKRAYILVNATDDFVYNAEDLNEAEVNAVRKLDGFKKIARTSYQIRVRKVASYKLLEEEYIDEEDFSIVPLYAKYRKNEFWGKVEGVKDLQRLLNKAYSQFSDIINKTANYGWFYDPETFPDKKSETHWVKKASSPGFNQKINDIAKPPLKIEGVRFPSELVNAIGLFSQTMRELMNINLEMQGAGGDNQSGIAIRQKIVQQLLGNDFLFDNLSFAKKKIGQIIVKKIQKLYTPDRIMRILNNQNMKEGVEIADKPLNDYDPEEIATLLNESDLAKYDVIAAESPSSPSAMMSNFLMMMELAGKGVAIPPQAILEFAPIPNKNKVMEMIAQSMEQQQKQETMKYETEIAKSLIAQEGKEQIPQKQQ